MESSIFRVEYHKDPFSVSSFLIYINDLYTVCCKSSPILFADDTNLFYRGKDVNVMARENNIELSQISLWLKTNKLSLNIKKTHFMLFHRKK